MKKKSTLKKLIRSLLFTLCLSFIVSVSHAQITKILSNDSTSVGYFGNFVDISGDYAIVAATDGNGVRPAAYIFFRSDSGWIQQAKIETKDIVGSYGGIGSVAISGDYAIVASSSKDTDIRGEGVVYVFKRNGENWILNSTLKSGDYPSSGSFLFGHRIDILGDYILVGGSGYYDSGFPSNQSVVHIFKRRANGWSLTQKIDVTSWGDFRFGREVFLSNNYASVLIDYTSGRVNGIEGINSAIYMSRRDGNRWVEDGLIRIDDDEKEEIVQFAESDGNVVVISNTRDGHSLYSFKKINGIWSKTSKTSINRSDTNWILSMDVHKDQLIIGGYINVEEYGIPDYEERGVVLLYKYFGNTWNQVYIIEAIDGEQGKEERGDFGKSVAISENYAIIGDPREGSSSYHQRGAAYVCDISSLLITGNEDITNKPFNIYPNPNNGTFAVHFENTLLTDNEIIVSDISGRIVKKLLIKKGQQNFKINLSDLNKGLYILRFVDSEKVYSSSIIIE
ncbi:T9SS type A sorting domain-containing protein [Bernardetia sp. Wsw4-3y2]|uniref:T9SS type A sorting domain-containing protein n=1 Tax=Bernardetia sp. Wsw4-3y2 TaxID=3127471 RepID=UPI0030D187C1